MSKDGVKVRRQYAGGDLEDQWLVREDGLPEKDWCWPAFFDAMHVGMIRVDNNQLVEVFNRTAGMILEISAEAMLGRPLEELERLVAIPNIGILCKASYLVDWEMRVRDKVVEVRKITVSDKRGRIAGQLILLNYTEGSHRLVGLNRLSTDAVISDLASAVTHEVRNPLAAIRGFTQLVRERLTSEVTTKQINDFLEIVVQEVDRLNKIVTQFAVLADHEHLSGLELELNKVVQTAWQILRPEFEARGVEACIELQEDLPRIRGDDDLLLQVVENLGRNAAQVSGPGERVIFRTRLSDAAVVLDVVDNGPGISVELQERIFLPFFTTIDGQTGLGLSICKHIVQRHGGRIKVYDGHPGTVFTVYLPLF